MGLEEGSTDVGVKAVRKVAVEGGKTGVHRGLVRFDWRGGGVGDGCDEELDEPGEAVLVHGVNGGQVRNAEVQEGGPLCYADVGRDGRRRSPSR